jgi:signal transduction histidine kinase
MIREYVKCQKGAFLSIVVAVFIFPYFESLLGIGLGDMIYSILLYLVVMSIYFSYQFYRFAKSYHKLKEIQHNVTIHEPDLPEALNPYDERYNEVIKNLYVVLQENMNQMVSRENDHLDYYTLWLHQIKTPIAAMHLVLQNADDLPQKPVLEQELFKVEQYVEMALQFIKIERIESDLVIQPYSLKDMVRQSIRKYSVLFIHKGLGVNIEGCEQTIITDSKWFCFILEQLFSNAVKYTNDGMIKVYTREVEGGVWLTIEDSGIGIQKEDRKRIFEKGYTGFNGRLDKKASGMGLYLVKKVATALNHEIQLESEVNKGTKVHLFLKDYSNMTKM